MRDRLWDGDEQQPQQGESARPFRESLPSLADLQLIINHSAIARQAMTRFIHAGASHEQCLIGIIMAFDHVYRDMIELEVRREHNSRYLPRADEIPVGTPIYWDDKKKTTTTFTDRGDRE
jgi:hypothetical protein